MPCSARGSTRAAHLEPALVAGFVTRFSDSQVVASRLRGMAMPVRQSIHGGFLTRGQLVKFAEACPVTAVHDSQCWLLEPTTDSRVRGSGRYGGPGLGGALGLVIVVLVVLWLLGALSGGVHTPV
jgi:hypothetical protein